MSFFSSLCACLQRRLKKGDTASQHGADDDKDTIDAGDSSDLLFDLHTLQLATNFFSELNQLGRGGFGPVFKGLMPNGEEVAIKKLSLESRQGIREFTNEVRLLLKIQHKNLVTLLGCCAEGPEKMLVYEYLPNKSLDHFLFDKKRSLDWTTRFRIVTGITRVAVVTFLLVLLYYYNCTSFLRHYVRFSAFFVLASMGGSILLSLIQRFSIPLDSITCFVFLFNFTIVGVLSIFASAIPIILRQCYMVCLGIIVAAWFTKLPEWTTWSLLVALAVYDLVAVLAPGGPLKLLVDLASSRNEELPALIYEARPTVATTGRAAALGFLVAGVTESGLGSGSSSIELQVVSTENEGDRNRNTHAAAADDSVGVVRVEDLINDEGERSPLVGNRQEERSPLVEVNRTEREMATRREEEEITERGIKLGLGDFVFYSVLVGRAAMYDLMTVYACYLAIISGLGCTLILLSVCRHALPALPISIALGVLFYFLTRLLMEPFIVGTATNLMMF